MTTSSTLTAAELTVLRTAGIAVFEDRLILEAQPPIKDAALEKIAATCAGPLPDELVALWRTCFGGRLAYDLRATFNGIEASVSFTELFYPKSGRWRRASSSLKRLPLTIAGRRGSCGSSWRWSIRSSSHEQRQRLEAFTYTRKAERAERVNRMEPCEAVK